MHVDFGMTSEADDVHQHEVSGPSSSLCGDSALCHSANAILSLDFLWLMKRGMLPFPVSDLLESTVPGYLLPPPTPRDPMDEKSTELLGPEPNLHGNLDDCSIDNNDNSNVSSSSSEKQPPRSKVSFRFAHPPPTTRRKRLSFRPRLLLQMQQVSQASRPVSVLDVIPSTLFGPRSTRRLPSALTGRDRLGPNDLIIIPSDTYDPVGSGEEDKNMLFDENCNEQRSIVATLCNLRKEEDKVKGVAEICLDQGYRWVAAPLSNGSYEFTATDENGVHKTVRWVMRGKGNRRSSGFGSGFGSSPEESKRFTFSIIDPNTRRHPVIGWMSRSGVDVLSQESLYSVYDQNPPGSPGTSSSLRAEVETDPKSIKVPQEQNLGEINQKLHTLVVATGIWVALREGWTQNSLSTVEPSPTSPTTPIKRTPSHSAYSGIAADNTTTGGLGSTDEAIHRKSQQQVRTGNRHRPNVFLRSTSQTTESWDTIIKGDSVQRVDMVKEPVPDDEAKRIATTGFGNKLYTTTVCPSEPDNLTRATRSASIQRRNPTIGVRPVKSNNPGLTVPRNKIGEQGPVPSTTPGETDREFPNPSSSKGGKSDGGKRKKWRKFGNWLDSVRVRRVPS